MRKGQWNTAAWSRVLLVIMALVLAGCSETTDDVMDRARALEEGGQYQAAIAEYRSVLADDADHAEARFGVGEASVYHGEYDRAVDSLQRAAQQGVSPDRVQPLLAAALLAREDFSAVLEQIDPDAVTDSGVQAELYAARALAHLRLGQSEEALTASERALSVHERHPAALIAAGRIAYAAGDRSAAKRYLDYVLEGDERPAAALITRAQIMREEGRIEDATALFAEAAQTHPTDTSASVQDQFVARGQQIELLLSRDRVDEAEESLEQMLRQSSQHPYANYLAGVLAYTKGDMEQAVERLQTAQSGAPDNVPIKALMGAVRAERGQYQQAIRLLREVVSDHPDHLVARLNLVAAHRGAGEERQAVRVLTEGIQRAGNDPQALSRLAAAAGDDIDSVIEGVGAGDDGARLNLARALVGAGEADPAIAMLRTMDPDDTDTDFLRQQLLAIGALREGNDGEALRIAEELVSDYPDRAQAHNLLGGIHLSRESYDAARESYQRARDAEPGAAQPHFNLGLVSASEGELDDAIEHFERGLERSPDNATAILRLAELQRQAGQTDTAIEWAQRATQVQPDSAQAWISLARLEIAFGEAERALPASERAVELAPDQPLPRALLALAQLGTGDPEAAVSSFQRALEFSPDDPGLRFQLARAQAEAGQEQDARATLRQVTETHPQHTESRAALIRLSLAEGNTGAALEDARAMQQQEGGQGQGALLEGNIHRSVEAWDEAIDAYNAAVEHGVQEALMPLVRSRADAGHPAPAEPLEEWLAEQPDRNDARFTLANWYLERGDYSEAVEHYEHLAEATDQGNPAILNNLAWLYSQLDDARAVDVARRAHELAPSAPQIADTLGWILLQEGQVSEAVELLSSAAEGAPDNAEIRYHYGAALAEAGDTEGARAALERALEMSDDADWSAEARELLDEL